MKQILRTIPLTALALAVITFSAQAVQPPTGVGDVTLSGSISAKSPMWRWTVNDYPSARLDAKPSQADTTVQGKVSYPLSGQWFIAASGYLPSFVPGKMSSAGTVDITTLTSPDGPIMLSTTANPATVTIPATGTDSSGQIITGSLVLSADEVRGYASTDWDGSGTTVAHGYLYAGATSLPSTSGGSCWVGRPASPASNYTKTQTRASLPTFSDTGPTAASGAIAALNAALLVADTSGAVRYAMTAVNGTIDPSSGIISVACNNSSANHIPSSRASLESELLYTAAAHILALKPQTLTFPVAATGAWNATLTVTAYQM
ncbi:hypothetical protein C2125_13560 [Rahnella aquatilis]|jgi:hypothetical protein|nr:hypothetical protein C2125_13560 [Rahnella aquatilis]